MDNEGLKLTEVAFRLHYYAHDFYRIFRKKMGMTVSEFRARYTSQDFVEIYYNHPKK